MSRTPKEYKPAHTKVDPRIDRVTVAHLRVKDLQRTIAVAQIELGKAQQEFRSALNELEPHERDKFLKQKMDVK